MEGGRARIGNWVKEQCLGYGAFGVVTLWKNQLTQQHMAIKMFKNTANSERYSNEIKMMNKLNHPNLVAIIPVPDELMKLSSRMFCMEYCKEGNLRKMLQKPENCSGLPERIIRKCLKNIKDALEYIHNESIIHRDLKPENIVLQKVNNEIVFKLIDFGFGKECEQNNLQSSLVGTFDYAAPEMLCEGTYSFSVDYWSFGFICHEMITGYRPFLPHLEPTIWMEKVRFKTDDVISVYEEPFSQSKNNIVFSKQLADEKHISNVFSIDLDSWFRLALRWDFKKRGRNKDNQLILFSSLDKILSKKIFTIFSTVSYEVLSYEIDESTTVLSIKENLFKDTGHLIENQVLILPTGEPVTDESSLVTLWDPSCEIAMTYAFTKEGVTLPLKVKTPSSTVISMTEEAEMSLSYHRRKRVFSSAVHFIQEQVALCNAFYEAVAVDLLSILKLHDVLSAREGAIRNDLTHCSAKLNMLRTSMQYNEKCYTKACESKAISDRGDFIDGHKKKFILFTDAWKRLEKELSCYSSQMQTVRLEFDKAKTFEDTSKTLTNLKTCLEAAYNIYCNLVQLPKEVKESEGNCTDMFKIICKFLEIMESFISDERFNEAMLKARFCKNSINTILPELDSLGMAVKVLNNDIEKAELGLFKAVWALKFTASNSGASACEGPNQNKLSQTAGVYMDKVEIVLRGPTEISSSTDRLLNDNRILNRQFDEFVKKYQNNWEEIKKSYEKYEEELRQEKSSLPLPYNFT